MNMNMNININIILKNIKTNETNLLAFFKKENELNHRFDKLI
jgi:hypothetical protein